MRGRARPFFSYLVGSGIICGITVLLLWGFWWRLEPRKPEPRTYPGIVNQLRVCSVEALNGFWNGKDLSVYYYPLKTSDGSFIDWSFEGVRTQTNAKWGSFIKVENWSVGPWIEFRFPDDARLYGKTLKIHIRMSIIYPAYHTQGKPYGKYINKKREIDDDYTLIVATPEEKMEYERWQHHISRSHPWYEAVPYFTLILMLIMSSVPFVYFFLWFIYGVFMLILGKRDVFDMDW